MLPTAAGANRNARTERQHISPPRSASCETFSFRSLKGGTLTKSNRCSGGGIHTWRCHELPATAAVALRSPGRPITSDADVCRSTVFPSYPQLLCLARCIAHGELLASSGLHRWLFHLGWIGISQTFCR